MVNAVWFFFILLLVVFFTLYSIFSKKKEFSDEVDINIYDNFRNIRKPKPIGKPKIFNRERKKKYVPKKTNDLIKIEKLIETTDPPETITPIEPPSIPSDKIKKQEISIKKRSGGNEKPVDITTKANGLEFKGLFDEDEINYLKKYSSKNRGFINQKLNGRSIINRWIKTKSNYDLLMEEIRNKIDNKGKYYTYIIWDSKVYKYVLNNKIK